MRPSEVRSRVLSDHTALRRDAALVEKLAGEVSEGREGALPALRQQGRQLHGRLCEHMRFEDAHLAPALRQSDAPGEGRAEHLAAAHREQRELLDYLLERLSDGSRPAVVLAGDLRSFAELLRDDMDWEEAGLLGDQPNHIEAETR